MKNSKCILWDFDNTLAYRDGKWTRSLVNVLENNGYADPDSLRISPFFKTSLPWNRWEEPHSDYFGGLSWWDFVNTVISDAVNGAGVPYGEENLRLTAQFREEYLRLDAWHLFPETMRNLEKSREGGFSNIIVSNHTPELEWLAEKLGISSYFDLILTSAMVGYDKPHRKFFEAVGKAGVFEKYYMIGDNYHADVLGGTAMGFEAILVRGDNSEKYARHATDLDGIWQYIS